MKMGKYCKAYPIPKLRQYAGWVEESQNSRVEKKEIDGKEVEAPRSLTDDDYLYLQENFVVTDGIFLDENIIYDRVTPEWMNYCKNDLKFEVPDFQSPPSAIREEQTAGQ